MGFRLVKAIIFTAAAAGMIRCSLAQAQAIDFARDVRPILERSCSSCHGPEKQKSGYRLDQREAAIRGGDSGNAAIVPHAAAKSPLIRLVSGADPDLVMPPKSSGAARLSEGEVALLRRWIDSGPAWPDDLAGDRAPRSHWSLLPLVRSQPPAGGANPIDGFIQSKLAEQGLHPAPPADARTLIRRVTYDLTGLPPTPQEVEAFAADDSPDAYERLVARLLASPRYGEHWARHWLDLAHYADTHGNDHDHARPNAWPYRDYVIRALNEDLPYPQFVQQQVAGDVLFPDDPRATAALGFLAAGPWDDTLMVGVREDTLDHQMAQNLDRDDMVSTVMSTFQSLTVHCARCHNHKFDPISQREYYGLQAVFAGVDRADRPFDADRETYARRRQLLAQKSAIRQRLPEIAATIDSPQTQTRVAAAEAMLSERAGKWQALDVVSVVSTAAPDGVNFSRLADQSWLVSGARPEKDTFVVTATTKLVGLRAIRLEVLPDESLPQGGPGRYDNGNFHLSEFHASARPLAGPSQGATKLEFTRVTADHADAGDAVTNTIDGRDDTYWSIHPRYREPHEAVFELKDKTGFEGGAALTVRLDFRGKSGHQIGRLRLSVSDERLSSSHRQPLPAAALAVLRIPPGQRTPDQRREAAWQLLEWDVERELDGLPAARLVYAVSKDFPPQGSFKPAPSPRPIHLLARGEITRPGPLVGPSAISCLPGLAGDLEISNPADESARRAALARWLTDSRNVLAWRSIVNRVWHYHFGRGLCDTPSDFGKMGGRPSHPQLLDSLAVWFRDDARGSLKALHRLIVTSQTYRQSAAYDSAAAERDGDNRMLWRMNRRRLSGEQLRDTVLQASGWIDLAMGGPAAVQFVDRGKATFMPDGGAPALVDYEHFPPDAPSNARRAVYRFVFRTVADPLLDVWDVPDGGSHAPSRSDSNTALQALALANDPFLIRQCEHLARRISAAGGSPEAQIDAAVRLLLQRSTTPAERSRLGEYAARFGLANACHLLLQANEFLVLD